MKHPRLATCAVAIALATCGPASRRDHGPGGPGGDDASGCTNACSADGRSVVDCAGNVIAACAPTDACDPSAVQCANACAVAQSIHSSVGCEYYATSMDSAGDAYAGFLGQSLCFAAFVANTSPAPAHIAVDYKGQALAPASFTRLPSGSGPSLAYAPYDPNAGLSPGQVAMLFLGGTQGAAPFGCPAPPATASPHITGTGIANSFHVTTDVPVVAYEMNPYGGGQVAVTGASLLLPTSTWDASYVAVNVSEADTLMNPSLNVVANVDGTVVTIVPTKPIVGGNGVPPSAAGQPTRITLNKGQHVQITQNDELTGSIVTATNPVGFMAGQWCMRVPVGTPYCDHGEQMIPPVPALGSHYVGVMYRPRGPNETATFWRLVGAVDGTQLVWSTPVGGPATLAKGQSVTFLAGDPFDVQSQDKDHPFMLFTYMTSSDYVKDAGGNAVQDGYGDPDFVIDVPPAQFLDRYVFFTDPTYPETDLVVIRARGGDGQFHDVVLDCAGALGGWQPVGADYEYTRADLQTGNFQAVGACSNGRHEISSAAPFGLQVWGWGTPTTTPTTQNVSYGYPGGMNVRRINDVVLE